MGVTVDWGRAVADAAGQGDGSGIVRGFRRLALRFSPAEIEPVVHAYGAAVNYEVGLLGSKIDRPHREARLVRHGLTIRTIGGESGLELQRDQAAKLLVASLASPDAAPRRPARAGRSADPHDRAAEGGPGQGAADAVGARVARPRRQDDHDADAEAAGADAPAAARARCGAGARRRGCKRLLREARPSGRAPRVRRHVRRRAAIRCTSCPPSTGWLWTCRVRPVRC